MTQEEKSKAYDEAIDKVAHFIKKHIGLGCMIHPNSSEAKELFNIFPELTESEDEKIRKEIISALKYANHKGVYDKHLAWLEKQGKKSIIIDIDKMVLKYSQTMDGDFGLPVNCQIRAYRQGINDALHLSLNLEKQGEQKPIINVPSREVILAIWDLGNEWKELTNGSISTEYGTQLYYIQKHWHESEYYLQKKQGEQKSAEWHKGDEQNLNACLGYIPDEYLRRWLMDVIHVKYDKPTDKVEPKFRVKYAGSEYNVFETKDIAGVTFYGIEDEPNHIDYVKAESCEIISGYGIKESGSPYPTKPVMFSEKKPSWSEEDKNFMYDTLSNLTELKDRYGEGYGNVGKCIGWLKTLKERVHPKNTWKPSDEQMKALNWALRVAKNCGEECSFDLGTLSEQLKKLKENNLWK